MFRKSLRVLPAVAIVLAMIVGALPTFASDAEMTFTGVLQGDEYITHYSAEHSGSLISTLDPQVATDSVSIDYIENLFLGLTDNDPITGQIEPELATSWSFDEATLTWTRACDGWTGTGDVPEHGTGTSAAL